MKKRLFEMARHLETSAKGENKNPSEFASVKSYGGMNRIRMAFNHHSNMHVSSNPRKFEDPLVDETMIGMCEAEYITRTGRMLR
jgi:hypothetical protein